MTGWRLPRLSVDRPCVGFLGYGNAQAHTEQGNMLIRDILDRMRHDGCGGVQGRRNCSPASRVSAVGRCGGSCWSTDDMTSIPDITRLLAWIHEWQDGHGKPGGRADAARRLDEAFTSCWTRSPPCWPT